MYTRGKPGHPTFDVLVGGWPCQGISCAGLCQGLKDRRSGLFFALARLLRIYNPPYFFFENVGSISGDTDTWRTVLETLTIELPYRVDWIIIPVPSLASSECGCPPQKKKMSVLALALSVAVSLAVSVAVYCY